MNTLAEEPEAKSQRTLEESTELFEEVARDGNIFQAYQAFNSNPIQQSLRIPDAVWKEMEPSLHEKMNEIKAKIRSQQKNQMKKVNNSNKKESQLNIQV